MQLILIEDDATIARELQLHWRARQWVVRACGTLAEGEAAMREASADLVVLDLQLPDGDGLRWLESLRRHDRGTPVLVLTARDQIADRVAGLRLGADDYLVKPFAPEELDARVEALLRRSRAARDVAAQCGPLVWLPGEGRAILDGQPLELSPREFEVLGLLVRSAPRLVYKRLLVEALAASNLEVGDSAVEVYVSRLRRKLAGSRVTVQTVRGFGYRLAVDAASAEDAPPGDAGSGRDAAAPTGKGPAR